MVKVSKNGINTSKLKPQERFIKLIQDGVLKSICYDPKEVADERKEELQGTLGKYFSLQAKIETNKDYETLAYSFLKSYSDILKSRKEELDLGILSKNKSMNIRI